MAKPKPKTDEDRAMEIGAAAVRLALKTDAVNMRISESLLARIDACAATAGVGRQEWVRARLDEACWHFEGLAAERGKR